MGKYEERCIKCFRYPACQETGNIYPRGKCPYYLEKEIGEKQVKEELKKLLERKQNET